MPTGYTAPIYENQEISPYELATQFARGLGFTMHQRDEPPSSPPREREPSRYNQEEMNKFHSELYRLKNSTDEQLLAEQDKEIAFIKLFNRQQVARYTSLRERYTVAVDMFEEWSPEFEAGQKVKEFALTQLRESIEFDCGREPFQQRVPERLSAAEYRIQRRNKLEGDLEGAKGRQIEENKRCDEANRWVKEFYKDAAKLPDGKMKV